VEGKLEGNSGDRGRAVNRQKAVSEIAYDLPQKSKSGTPISYNSLIWTLRID
jgi:hypothetical protein